jgi:hypothetical protein
MYMRLPTSPAAMACVPTLLPQPLERRGRGTDSDEVLVCREPHPARSRHDERASFWPAALGAALAVGATACGASAASLTLEDSPVLPLAEAGIGLSSIHRRPDWRQRRQRQRSPAFILNAGASIYNQSRALRWRPGYKTWRWLQPRGGRSRVLRWQPFLQATSISTAGYNLNRGDVGYTTGGMWDETRLVDQPIYAGATLTIPTGEF